MQKAVSSAICMKWPLHRRRWDRSHRWTKSFDLERLWRMSTTTSTLIYNISCNTMQRCFKFLSSCSITIHVMIPPFSISAMWIDSRSARSGDLRLSASRSRHRYNATLATLWLHCYTLGARLNCFAVRNERNSVCVPGRTPEFVSSTTSCQNHLGQKGFIHFTDQRV